MNKWPLCQVGDIIQYDWDKDDNIFLVTHIYGDYDGWIYHCLSLTNGSEATYQLAMAPLEILA